MTQGEFDQEWYLSPDAANQGSVLHGGALESAHGGPNHAVPYEPQLPVDTDWDLGVGDSTAIWFTQSFRSGEVRVIDYYENTGEGIPHYARVLRDKGYTYGEHGPRMTFECGSSARGRVGRRRLPSWR